MLWEPYRIKIRTLRRDLAWLLTVDTTRWLAISERGCWGNTMANSFASICCAILHCVSSILAACSSARQGELDVATIW